MTSKLVNRLISSLKVHSNRRLVTFKSNFFYKRYTYGAIFLYTKKFITLLKDKGLKKGDRILICSYNCPQYLYAFLGGLFYGIVLVPIDYGSSSKFINKIAKETQAKLILTSSYKILKTQKKTLFIEELEDVLEETKESSPFYDIEEEDLVEIMYTSGTTSVPKGVLLSHKNIEANLKSVFEVLEIDKDFIFISIIPLSHMFEQIAGLFVLVASGAQTVQLQSRRASEIRKVFKQEHITALVAVPAFLDLMKISIEKKAEERGRLDKLKRGLKVAPKLPMFARRILFRRIHNELGGKLTKAVSGGAPLNPETELFWESIGVKVVQGYGLTEASPVLTIGREDNRKIGSVGEVIPDVELKLGMDNEILAKGDNITRGYYKRPKETKNLFKEGWLRTGDIGYFDEDGFLYIKGRVKNMILKSSGLNVYPEDIEKVLNGFDEIKQSCVIGKPGRSDVIICACLIFEKGIKKQEKEAKRIISLANKKLEYHQQIQDFVIWNKHDFPKTHTLKIKRNLVIEEVMKKEKKIIDEDEGHDLLINVLSEASNVPRKDIRESSNLYTDLKFDSIKVIGLAALIEEKMHKEIEEFQIDKNTTVKKLREILEKSEKATPKIKLSKKYFHPIWIPIRLLTQEIVYATTLIFCNIKVGGRQHLKDLPDQHIIIFNHTSYFDGPVVVKHLPIKTRAKLAGAAAADHFFVKKKVIDHRMFVGRIMQLFSLVYPMSRDRDVSNRSSFKKSLEFTGEVIDKGYSLMLSPEGTRSATGKLIPFKKGIGIIVKESGLPVLPIKIEGLYEIYPRQSKLPKKRGDVHIQFGKLVKFKHNDSVVNITNKLESTIRDM